MPEISIQQIKSNGKLFVQEHQKAREVLSKTNGTRDYKEIASLLNLHETTVSHLLSLAYKLDLAEKIEAGIYKKKTGVMTHVPKTQNIKTQKPDIPKIIKRANKQPKNTTEVQNFKSSRPFKHLNGMIKGYQNLYIAENTLRELIRKVLGRKTSDWWNSHVNKGIRDSVSDTISNSPYDGYSRHDELEYTHLGQLKEIITSKRNWKLFKKYLHEQNSEAFKATIDKAIPSRNSIGHCIPLNKRDLRYVEMRFQDIIKMIK